MIYADNAATSGWIPPEVIEAVQKYLMHPGNPGHSSCKQSMNAARSVLSARKDLARFFDVPSPDHVIFTSGATEALNIALRSLARPGIKVAVSVYEHNAVLRTLYDIGADVLVFDGTAKGLSDCLQQGAGVVAVSHISNVTGQRMDISSLARLAHDHGAWIVVDAAQSTGLVPVHLKEMDLDVLCFAGHKGLHGMQGCGGLAFLDGLELKPLKTGGTGSHSFDPKAPHVYPDMLEQGTINVPGILSLQAGVKWIESTGLDTIEKHARELNSAFVEGLKDCPGVRVYSAKDGNYSGIACVDFINRDNGLAAMVLQDKYGIETREGVHCSPLIHKALNSSGLIRFSFGWQNTMNEVQACVAAVREMAA